LMVFSPTSSNSFSETLVMIKSPILIHLVSDG
jgi:hypothetical protein